MMICPETYYEEYLKGKNAEQIMTAIRGLKQEIGRLKNIAEHPDYQCMIHPSEGVRISCIRDYIERAKQALVEALKGEDIEAIKARQEDLQKEIFAISEKIYKAANPQGAEGAAQDGAQADPNVYEADYTDVEDK